MGAQIICSFKRKRFPGGRLNKHKSILCAHGVMQQWGDKYWETYSSVVNMLSARLLLAICHIHGLDSKAINFVLAFPQADLDIDIWMELPEGIVPDDDEENKSRYDANEFVKAMEVEVQAHEQHNNWTVGLRSNLPSGAKMKRAIWSYKKRFPDGQLNKNKARLCLHGRMQQWGDNYW